MPQESTDGPSRRHHWESVHAGKPLDGVSWWEAVPRLSLDLVAAAGLELSEPIVDVGSGSSTLADHLVARGHTDVTLVELSSSALEAVRERLPDVKSVHFQVDDVLTFAPDREFTLWHDRAVFHFLTQVDDRDAYRESLRRSIKPGGWLAIATFGPEGPATCSGLPIVRYSLADLAAEFPDFEVAVDAQCDHLTPWGSHQQFSALLMRRF